MMNRTLGVALAVAMCLSVAGRAHADSLTYYLTGPNDDLEEVMAPSGGDTVGDLDPGSSDLELGTEGPPDPNQAVALRYLNVDIGQGQGSTIQSANLQFTVDEDDNEVTSVRIFGELTPNSPLLDHTSPFNLTGRNLTTSSVVWSNIPVWPDTHGVDAGPDQLTPDLVPIVQEIVNQAGWASGNAMTFIIFPDPLDNDTGERTAVSYNGLELADSPNAGATALIINDNISRPPLAPLGNIGFTRFAESASGSQSYVASTGGTEELGFEAVDTRRGRPIGEPGGDFIGVVGEHFSMNEIDRDVLVNFDAVDISNFTDVVVSADVRVEQASSGWEDSDNLRIFVEANPGGVEFDLFALTSGDALELLQDGLFTKYSVGIPDEFDTVRVVIQANSDSSSEFFMFDNIAINGVPEPSSMVLVLLGALGIVMRCRQRAK